MRRKNENIQLFILEEDRRRKREHAVREKAQQLVGQRVILPSDTFDQAPNLEVTENAEVWTRRMKIWEGGIIRSEHKAQSLRIAAGMIVCAFTSTITLLWLDGVVSRNLSSEGFQLGLKWATSANVIVLGMLWLVAFSAALFQRHALSYRSRVGQIDH